MADVVCDHVAAEALQSEPLNHIPCPPPDILRTRNPPQGHHSSNLPISLSGVLSGNELVPSPPSEETERQ